MNALLLGLLVTLLLDGSKYTTEFGRAGAQPDCDDDELVALYPGYPGFRGYLPDTVGALEWVCPDELPSRFEPDEEDEDNKRAADRLDISGSKEDWTWENWMAIEAQRGLPPTCFVCAIFNSPVSSQLREPSRRVDRDGDPRYLIGSLTEKNIALHWADSIGGNRASIVDSAPTDLQLKALSGLTAVGEYLTAQEVIDLSEELLALLFDIDDTGFRFDTGKACRHLFDQHGYAPTPKDASIDDQAFMFVAGFHGVSFLLAPATAATYQSMLSQLIQDWQMAVMSDVRTPSLGEWLQDRRDDFGC